MDRINYQIDRARIESFQRCVLFTMARVGLYRKGKVDERTMRSNIEEARRINAGIKNKGMVAIMSQNDLKTLEREFIIEETS